MIRVLIADDQHLLLQLLSRRLQATGDIQITGTAADGLEAVELALKTNPDIVLLDIKMPIMDGIEAARQIKQQRPDIKILMLTESLDETDILASVAIGIEGYVPKTIHEEELLLALRSIHANLEVFHSSVQQIRFRPPAFEKIPVADGLQVKLDDVLISLSSRDLEIIQMIIEGIDTPEMARLLFLSEGRLRNLITELLGKLMVKDRTQLAVLALTHHLVTPKS